MTLSFFKEPLVIRHANEIIQETTPSISTPLAHNFRAIPNQYKSPLKRFSVSELLDQQPNQQQFQYYYLSQA